MATQADFLVVGGGIAGASVGYWLAPHGKVVVLEREPHPGYHSTGRSAALFMESYGTAQVRALTMASRAFLEAPPAGFSEHPLLTRRGAMMVATHGEETQLGEHWSIMRQTSPKGRLLDPADACALTPVLRREEVIGAVHEPDAADIDVHALHQGFLRGIRRAGGTIATGAEVVSMERLKTSWRLSTPAGSYEAPIVLNAAGAWADEIARLAGARPIGLEPRRRSAFIFAPPAGCDCSAWPMTAGMREDWYIKPDAGMLLGSPANVDPVPAHDVQPEELDIAIAIDRIERMTTLRIRRPTRTWAGLRSFVRDGDLVGGWDLRCPGFFWVAAQGGYGIQTAPAMGEACAALARGQALPARIAAFGIGVRTLAPDRLFAGADGSALAPPSPH